MRLLKSATPVKAKTSAPAPGFPASCAALTWRGFEEATRTGSRERGSGGGRRWTGSRTVGEPLHRQGKERFGNRLGDSVGASRTCIRLIGKEVAPFFVSKKPGGSLFSLSTGPQI